MFKYRLLLILFLATILIYVAVLVWSFHDCQEWKRRDIQRWVDKFGPQAVGFLDYLPYISTRHGLRLLWLGLAIGVVWVVGFSLLGSRMGTRELKLLRIAIPLCGVLCFLLGILAFAYYEYQPIPGDSTPYSDYAIPFGLLGIIFFPFSPRIWFAARQDR